jgi:hypothetical protein
MGRMDSTIPMYLPSRNYIFGEAAESWGCGTSAAHIPDCHISVRISALVPGLLAPATCIRITNSLGISRSEFHEKIPE